MANAILKVSVVHFEPYVRMVFPEETPDYLHSIGCGIVSVDQKEYDEYLAAAILVNRFHNKTRALAEADLESAKEYNNAL